MKKAIVCFRPYQLFSYVNMAVHNTEGVAEDTDLYLLDLPSLKPLKQRIKKSGLFSQVYLFKDLRKAGPIKRKLDKARDFAAPQRAIRRDLYDRDVDFLHYRRIFSAGWIYFFLYLCQVNPKAEVVMGDDGTASYEGDFRYHEITGIMKLFTKVTGRGPGSVKISRMYLNEPKLLMKETDFPVLGMPKLNVKSVEVLKNLFAYQKSKNYNDKKLVILTQGTFRDQRKTVEKIQNIFCKYKSEAVVRRHPAQKRYLDMFEGFDIDEEQSVWEILASDVVHNDSILISQFSTAQFTPWVFYGKKPILVFLYKLLDEKGNENENPIQDWMIEQYPGKSYIPENIDELQQTLQILTGDKQS